MKLSLGGMKMLTAHSIDCIHRFESEIDEIDEQNKELAEKIVKNCARKTVLKKWIREIKESAKEAI